MNCKVISAAQQVGGPPWLFEKKKDSEGQRGAGEVLMELSATGTLLPTNTTLLALGGMVSSASLTGLSCHLGTLKGWATVR